MPNKIQTKLPEKSIWSFKGNPIFINSIDSRTLKSLFSEIIVSTLKDGTNVHKIKSSNKKILAEQSQYMLQMSSNFSYVFISFYKNNSLFYSVFSSNNHNHTILNISLHTRSSNSMFPVFC